MVTLGTMEGAGGSPRMEGEGEGAMGTMVAMATVVEEGGAATGGTEGLSRTGGPMEEGEGAVVVSAQREGCV